MASLNKVMIIGNLGQDPEVRYTADGTGIATVSLATSRFWRDKTTGERKEETEWHRVVFFDTPYSKLAENVGQYAKKGRPLYVEGRLKTRKWTDKDGIEKYTTEIVADQMQLLGSREGDGAGRSNEEGAQGNYGGAPARSAGGAYNGGGSGAGGSAGAAPARRPAPAPSAMDDDDIPF